jgi:Cutinase
VFGDPNKGKAIRDFSSSNIYTDCDDSDPICKGIPLPLGTHLTYLSKLDEKTKILDFVKQKVM